MNSATLLLFGIVILCLSAVSLARDTELVPKEIPFAHLPYCKNLTGTPPQTTYQVCYGFFGTVIAFSNTVWFTDPVWIGMGFHAVGSNFQDMQQGDFFVGTFNDNGTIATVADRYCDCANGGSEPSLDTEFVGGEDNVLEFGGKQYQAADGTWVGNYYFSRYLNTGDTAADHVIGGGAQHMVWAHGTSNVFGYHQSNKGEFTADLTDPYNY